MKRKILSILMTTLAAAFLLTACSAADPRQTPPAEETEAVGTADSQTAQNETTPSQTQETGADTQAGEIDASETEISPDETGYPDGLEEMQFTVDVTDNLAAESGLIIGNASTIENYSGILEIHVGDVLAERAAEEIRIGSTYVFTVQPMMTMSIPPQVVATDFTPADDSDIERLEEIRKSISNYGECMERYQDMSLADIVQDANFNYALWTQEEITEFMEFLAEKGYPDDSEIKCYVNVRTDLNGSISGASAE